LALATLVCTLFELVCALVKVICARVELVCGLDDLVCALAELACALVELVCALVDLATETSRRSNSNVIFPDCSTELQVQQSGMEWGGSPDIFLLQHSHSGSYTIVYKDRLTVCVC